MNKILTGVVEGGTGTAAKIGRPAAGKTGTSEEYQNAWFVGYTPILSTAVWVGHKEGNIPLRGVRGVGSVAGGTWPARLWHDYMVEAMRGVPPTEFTQPAPIESLADRAKREARGGFDLGGRIDAPGHAGRAELLPERAAAVGRRADDHDDDHAPPRGVDHDHHRRRPRPRRPTTRPPSTTTTFGFRRTSSTTTTTPSRDPFGNR